jgi:hypothetical protein
MRWLLIVWAFVSVDLVAGAWAHDWYTGQRNPVTGASCCGTNDCVPLEPGDLKVEGSDYVFRYPLNGKSYRIPMNQALPSRDSRVHACVWGDYSNEAPPKLCIFVGGGT